jgi:hypothetical protein
MGDFLDIDDTESFPSLPVAVADLGDPVEKLRVYENAWANLSVAQKLFLNTYQECRFNISKTWRKLGKGRTSNGTEYRWRANEHYAFCKKVLETEAMNANLDKAKLINRQNDCVEQLLEERPIFYKGEPTGFFENQP